MKKRVAITLISLLGALMLGLLGAETWLRHAVRVAVERALGGVGAEVEIGRVGVSVPLRQVSVRDVRVRGGGGDASPGGSEVVSFEMAVPRLTLRGVGWNRVGERLSLSVSRLTVDSPRATLVTRDPNKSEEEPPRQPPVASATSAAEQCSALSARRSPCEDRLRPPPQEGNPPSRIALRIDEVAVAGGVIELVRWSAEGAHSRLVVGGARAAARGVSLESIPDDVSLAADSLMYAPPGGATIVRADDIELDTADKTVSLAALSLIPQFDKARFAELSPGHRDWTSVSLGDIDCHGVDFARLIGETPAVSIDSMWLASADIDSYKNRQVFSPATTKPLLHETIRQLPIPLEIGTLDFAGLDITYEELAERADSPGAVTITDGHGRASNITNTTGASTPSHTTIEIRASLMHSGELEARMVLPVGPNDDRWELTGRLGPTDMRAFNGATEPLMNVRMASGAIRSLEFDMEADSARSHTSLTMLYEDLKVELLDRHDHTRVRRFLTAVADEILIRPDNPSPGGRGATRSTEADTARDHERSMWNYIWRSLEGAILKTLI